jgi:hypothetical protein
MEPAYQSIDQIKVEFGETVLIWNFVSDQEALKAKAFAAQIGLPVLADRKVPAMWIHEDERATSQQFREKVLGWIMSDRSLRHKHQDALDALYAVRVIDVRNALRAKGWGGGPWDTLEKDGANAVFHFEHTQVGRNIIGMSINGIEDALTMPADQMAAMVTNGAHEHLKMNRRVDVQIITTEGCAGSYKVYYDQAGQIVESKIEWKPESPAGATVEVRLRMRRYGRLDGSAYTLGGDTWRELESADNVDKLWSNLLTGVAPDKALQKALGLGHQDQSDDAHEVVHARKIAAMYQMSNCSVAGNTELAPHVGPVVAITPAYVVQNVGMNKAVLHPVTGFDTIPAMGANSRISYKSGRAVVIDEKEPRAGGLSR